MSVVMDWVDAIERTPMIGDLTEAVQAVLSRDLLSKKEKERHEPSAHRTTGHCAIASEAMLHLLRIFYPDLEVKPMCATYREQPSKRGQVHFTPWAKGEHDESERETHWWLECSYRAQPAWTLDATGHQYWSRLQSPPYRYGVGKGFQGRKCRVTGQQLPTKRAAIVINRALERIAVQQCGATPKTY